MPVAAESAPVRSRGFGRRLAAALTAVAVATATVIAAPAAYAAGAPVGANIRTEQQTTGTLTATVTPTGVVELRWSFPAVQAASYAVHRGTPTVSSASEIRRTTVPTVADENVEPGVTYAYTVDALAADGTVLASTAPVDVAIPASAAPSFARTIVVAGEEAAGTARVSWALADDAPTTDLSLVVDGVSTPVSGKRGSVDVAASADAHVALVSAGRELGNAVVASGGHPRSILDDDTVAGVRSSLAAGAPTATGAWNAMLGRLANPSAPGAYITNGSAGFYEAREAAFAFAVTGDQAFAEQAYTATLKAEPFITKTHAAPGLEISRSAALLPAVYDWAYNGWTEQQRAYVRMLMLRTSELLSTYHQENLDGPHFESNWAGIVRSTELSMLLALRGDAGTPDLDRRILTLADQVGQHFDHGYTDEAWYQEGWDYFHYTELYLFPAMYFVQGAGVTALDSAFQRPDYANIALHVVSSREFGDIGQYGVAGPNKQVDGTFPLLFPLADQTTLPGLMHLYDRVHGVDSVRKSFDGAHGLWTILYYPTDGTVAGVPTSEKAHRALLDDKAGFAAFRDGYQDANDNIVVTSNRNIQHPKGWAAAETFSLSWVGQDTTWALLGGKSYNKPLLWSKPLVDGKLEPYENQFRTADGRGVTLDSRAFAGQGGGYLSLDGSENFGVDTAHREEIVDLRGVEGGPSAIVAINDTFADDTSHRWDWQLRPEAGVVIQVNADSAETEPLFTFTSTDAAGEPVVLSGFVLGRDGLTAQVIDGTLRLSREGTEASFKIVLATAETPLTASIVGDRVLVSQTIVPIDRLGEVPECGLIRTPTDLKTTALASWERTFVCERNR